LALVEDAIKGGFYALCNHETCRELGFLERARSQRPVLLPQQIRAARVFLGWSRAVLARKSGVPVGTLEKIEAGKTDPRQTTIHKLKRTLEDGGIEFLEATRERGPGVIWRDGKLPTKR
jgi:DNA-binding XRE family transcriptional regulator